jgi:hypothetical protein
MLLAGGAAVFPHTTIYHKGNMKVKRFFRGEILKAEVERR